MKKKYYLLFILFTCTISGTALAQEGHFINLWGGGQQSWLLNRDDYSSFGTKTDAQGDRLLLEETYRSAFGIDYTYNFDTSFGLQTGLVFSRQGQKYSGVYNIRDTADNREFFDFKSQVLMDYIKLPVMFRFNSPIEEGDRYNMSLYAGVYVGYLLGVTDVSTTPPTDSVNVAAPDFNKYYKKLDIGFAAGAQMNIFLSKVVGLNFGIRYDRGFVDIENKNYPFTEDLPAEYFFPLSTKKSIIPSVKDALSRLPTRNTSVSVFIGLAFKIG